MWSSVLSHPERTTLSHQREALIKVTPMVQEHLFKKCGTFYCNFQNGTPKNKQTKPYLKEIRYVVLQVLGYRRQADGGGPAHDVTKCQERAADACGIVLTIAQLITKESLHWTGSGV